MQKPRLIVIAGPTAVGKTKVSVQVAKALQTEIVSADARQIFKETNIGTARPTPEEMAGIAHHLVASHSIFDPYSVGDFEQETLQLLQGLFAKFPSVIMTGGSGLYVRAVCDGLDEMPTSDTEIRELLQERLELEGLPALVQQLTILDPEFGRIVDVHNPQRVIRALEVCLSTGKPFSSFRTGIKADRPFRSVKIGLERDRAELYKRIDLRVDEMLDQGLVEEATRPYPHRHLNALQTVGYSEIFDFLDGRYDLDEAIRLIKRNSRRYAKRQLTWFRKDPEFTWFHADDVAGILDFVKRS